jgi:hypothetical protein
MKLKRLIGVVMVGLVVAMATAMNAKGGISMNGLKPGAVATMTNPPGITYRADRPYPLKYLADRPVVKMR